ncbi:MAG: hypothetical protein ACRDIC_14915 [bacterium]
MGAVLVAVGTVYLALLPFVQVRAAIPAIAGAVADAEQRISSAEEALTATAAVLAGTAEFRRSLDAAPGILGNRIADLVARGQAAVGPGGNPYKAPLSVPRDANPGGPSGVEDVLVEEAIRREIGRHIDALSLSLEMKLEPLRLLTHPPMEAEDAYRAGQAVGREIMGLNQILQEAFGAQQTFWIGWQGPNARFGTASARAGDAMRAIEDGLRDLDERLVAASAAWKGRQEHNRATIEALRAQQSLLNERLAEFPRRLGWLPVDLEDALRTFPVAAGLVAMTVLFRIWHILRERRAPAAPNSAAVAPWGLASLPTTRRWSVVVLLAAPLIVTTHMAVVAIGDRALFSMAGDRYRATMVAYGVAYALPILVGAGLLLGVAVGLGRAPRMRPAAPMIEARTS